MNFKNLKLKDFLAILVVLIVAASLFQFGPKPLIDLIFGAEGIAVYDGFTTGQLALIWTGVTMFLARSWLHYAIAVTVPKFIVMIPARVDILGAEIPLRVCAYLPFEVYFNIALFGDKLVSALIPGRHHQLWRTVSYRLGAWKHEGNPVATFICVTFLHPFQNNHCKMAFEADEGGNELFVWVRALDLT